MPKNWEVKKANVELHNKTAKYFEERNVELFNMFEQRNLDERLRKANQTCKKHEVCCDLACGTGSLIERQILEFEGVIGLDISRGMIAVCKAKGLGNKARFLVGDAENLPFPDNVFDIVTMHAALHHIPSPSNCFKEIYRVLSEEGIMYIDHEPNSKRLRNILGKVQRILSSVGYRRDSTRARAYSSLFPPEYGMADVHVPEGFIPRDVRKQLEMIGFYEVKTRYHNTFSSYFFRLPTPFNALSFVDNVLDNLPLIRQLSTHICIWAKK